jgi:hypothetical protein
VLLCYVVAETALRWISSDVWAARQRSAALNEKRPKE